MGKLGMFLAMVIVLGTVSFALAGPVAMEHGVDRAGFAAYSGAWDRVSCTAEQQSALGPTEKMELARGPNHHFRCGANWRGCCGRRGPCAWAGPSRRG
jgi:hypothetical protein